MASAPTSDSPLSPESRKQGGQLLDVYWKKNERNGDVLMEACSGLLSEGKNDRETISH